MCAAREGDSSGILIGIATRVYGVKYFFREWELTLSNRHGVKVPTEGKKSGCSTKFCLVPWEWGQVMKKVCYRPGLKAGRLDLEEMWANKYLMLIYLLCWPTCFSGRLVW